MVVVDARGEPERERMLARQLADQLVDGLIISPLDPSDASWADICEMLPIVTVGDALPGPTVGEVLFDNRAGVGLVLEHLHALGHRRIAVLTPSRPSTPDRPAERVVAEVCDALGLEATVVNTRHSIEEATEAATALLARDPRPTAVFCHSDSIACGVYAAAAAAGLEIPGDLSVSGYDDHPIARVVSPPLTSVGWGLPDVAASAAGLLAAAVAGRPKARSRARVRVAPELVERGSTAAPAIVPA
jgi:LacI family transcriptional regulator